MKNLNCSFFGHRKIDITENLKQNVKHVVENLIVNHNVTTFLFGSRSEFNDLCYFVVTELKEKYGSIKRVMYTCKSEVCLLESEKQRWQVIYFNNKSLGNALLTFDEEFEHQTKFVAGKASYIERNQAMINTSDYCVFYYDKNYEQKNKKIIKNSVINKIKSGTAAAFKYAKQNKKHLINLFENKNIKK